MFVFLFAMLATEIQDGPAWIAPWVDVELEAPHWIWTADYHGVKPTPAGTSADAAFLTRFFRLDRPATARLVFATDNSATIAMDGDEVMKSTSHSSVTSVEIELEPGLHTLSASAENSAGTDVNPAGLVGVIDLTFENGDRERIITDGAWNALQTPIRSGTDFLPLAVDMGRCDIAPWGLSPSVFRESQPCPILRRSFELESLPKSAKVRVIGLGHYELRLNGQDVSPTVIDQAWSQYDKRLFWQEFDLLPFLRVGENVFGALLGNSFWRVDATNDPNRFAKTDAMPDFSDGRPFLLWVDASFSFDDGTTMRLTTDDGWKWDSGPLTFSHIYGGEDWDARLVQDGWDGPGFDDGGWKDVMVVDAPPAKLAKLPFPGLKEFERFAPTRVARPEPDVTTYVFPQNCSALLEFVVEGDAGD
ncbi:MAG: alpha-L-rhamnosidase N-terminal domain-containing protein, partial [Armatimonadetes bacterium]|nr:alpha-L-rhamnosidase N-terminal domain-containing protein [Armatimonadota bacterium]